MSIINLIICVVSVASLGFASDGLSDQENKFVDRATFVVKPIKRGRPAGSIESAAKSKSGVSRVLVDVTNTVDVRPVRDRKTNSLINSDHLDGKSEKPKVSSGKTIGRKTTKSKKKAKTGSMLQTSALTRSGDAEFTTSEEGSFHSRTSSFNTFSASSPIWNEGEDINALNESFGFDLGFDDEEYTVNSEPHLTAVVGNLVPGTPTAMDLLDAAAQDATPFVEGGSDKGQIYTPFDPRGYRNLLLDVLSPEAPVLTIDFDELAQNISW